MGPDIHIYSKFENIYLHVSCCQKIDPPLRIYVYIYVYVWTIFLLH